LRSRRFALKRCGAIEPHKGKSQTALTVKGFLNRIFAVPMTLQGRIFSYFHELFETIVSGAKRANKFSEGIIDCSGESIRVTKNTMLREGGVLGGKTRHVVLEVDRGVPWDVALERYVDAKGDGRVVGFYVTKQVDKLYMSRVYMLAIGRRRGQQQKDNPKFFTCIQPNTGYAPQDMPATQLRKKWELVADIDQVQRNWRRVYAAYKMRSLADGAARHGGGGGASAASAVPGSQPSPLRGVHDGLTMAVVNTPSPAVGQTSIGSDGGGSSGSGGGGKATPMDTSTSTLTSTSTSTTATAAAAAGAANSTTVGARGSQKGTAEPGYGQRIKKHHVITGSVLQIWKVLWQAFKIDSKADGSKMKIVRMQTDDGSRSPTS
jgi:hypothetical protein